MRRREGRSERLSHRVASRRSPAHRPNPRKEQHPPCRHWEIPTAQKGGGDKATRGRGPTATSDDGREQERSKGKGRRTLDHRTRCPAAVAKREFKSPYREARAYDNKPTKNEEHRESLSRSSVPPSKPTVRGWQWQCQLGGHGSGDAVEKTNASAVPYTSR